MEKIILLSIDLLENIHLVPEKGNPITVIDNFVKNITDENCGIIFYSSKQNRVEEFENRYSFLQHKYPKQVVFKLRVNIQKWIKRLNEARKSGIIVIGTQELHFRDAVNDKLLFITPTWLPCHEQAQKYGIKVHSLSQIEQLVNTLVNQKTWYSTIELPDGTKVISLSDARSYPKYAKTVEEREIVNLFRSILKDGTTTMYEVYLYHFLAAMNNNKELFYDINDWGCFPTSKSDSIEQCEMYKFKEVVRNMMKGGTPRNDLYKAYPNILLRHTTNNKSRTKDYSDRINEGCTTHFDTVCINPAYIKKLKGRNVCIFDDYLTHGNSFECARNLLRSAGVNKLVFVTLGRFPYPYQYQEYMLTGDIYGDEYTYRLKGRSVMNTFKVDSRAKKEVENLYNIFNIDK